MKHVRFTALYGFMLLILCSILRSPPSLQGAINMKESWVERAVFHSFTPMYSLTENLQQYIYLGRSATEDFGVLLPTGNFIL